MRRRFGREFAADKRDRKYRVRAHNVAGVKHWNEGTWRGDQAELPACVGYGWTAWLAGDPIRQWLDPVGLYRIAQQFDEWVGDEYEGTSVRAGAKVLAMLGYIDRYEWAFDVDEVIWSILEVGPMVVGTNWLSGMDEVDGRGIVGSGGELLGGHAYLLSGVDTRKGLFRLRCAWPEFGDEGRASIPIEQFADLLAADGEACLAVERKAGPRG